MMAQAKTKGGLGMSEKESLEQAFIRKREERLNRHEERIRREERDRERTARENKRAEGVRTSMLGVGAGG